MSPVHPGKILCDEFLEPMALSVYRLAQAIKVPRPRLNDIVLGAVALPLTPRCAMIGWAVA